MKETLMFPKAYIFYSVPNAKMYLHIRTPKTANVELADYNPYLSHNTDVRFMWDIARFQHPQAFFQNVIVVPVINLKTLTYANLIKDKEAIIKSKFILHQITKFISKKLPSAPLFTVHDCV